MKIIIPVLDNRIAGGFNQTPDVCVFDTQTDGREYKPWRDIIPPGTKITRSLKAYGITSVLVSQIQLLALNLFRDNGIDVYKSIGDILDSNIKHLKLGKLELYTVENALENNKLCGGSCEECTTEISCK